MGLTMFFSSVSSALWVHVALTSFTILKFGFLHLLQFTVAQVTAAREKQEGGGGREGEREGGREMCVEWKRAGELWSMYM